MYFAANTIMIVALISCAVLFWLFCMFTTANIARSNGENYNLWMLIGLFTGPVGLLFTLVYFRFSGERYRRIRHGAGKTYDMPEIVQCPGCGQSVPSGFNSCQFCGAALHGHRR
ncbi:MAG: hypothetical protein ACYC99_15985 [Candidatus Geothermincolia bacterium]